MLSNPPIGIIPRHIHDQRRLEELHKAIIRYTEVKLDISIEWINEYNELINRLKPNN